MKRFLTVIFIYAFFSSCNTGPTEDIIPKEKMIPLLTDLHLADGYAANELASQSTNGADEIYKAIYNKYSTDSLGLRKSLEYYSKTPEDLETIYKEVEKNMTRLLKEDQQRLVLKEKRRQQLEAQKQRNEKMRAKFANDRLKMLKGEYDFGLSTYKWPEEKYLKLWKKSPKKARIKTPVDTLNKANPKRVY
jgi:hypothetical protein